MDFKVKINEDLFEKRQELLKRYDNLERLEFSSVHIECWGWIKKGIYNYLSLKKEFKKFYVPREETLGSLLDRGRASVIAKNKREGAIFAKYRQKLASYSKYMWNEDDSDSDSDGKSAQSHNLGNGLDFRSKPIKKKVDRRTSTEIREVKSFMDTNNKLLKRMVEEDAGGYDGDRLQEQFELSQMQPVDKSKVFSINAELQVMGLPRALSKSSMAVSQTFSQGQNKILPAHRDLAP